MTTTADQLRDELRGLALLIGELTDAGWSLDQVLNELRCRATRATQGTDLVGNVITDLVLAAAARPYGLDHAEELLAVWRRENVTLSVLASWSAQVLHDLAAR